jgi:5-methylcytosine-specific restriction enzyme A
MARLNNLGSRVKPLGSRVRVPAKQAESFYVSREWRALVKRIKFERGPWCERCGSSKRVIADHIIERKDGGADLDPSNIELLCFDHHAIKTVEARRRRAAGLSGAAMARGARC